MPIEYQRVVAALWLPIGLVIWLLSGCGFHLREAVEVPAQLTPIYVQGGGAIRRTLDERFNTSGVALAGRAEQARVIIRIHEEHRDRRVSAVDRDGKVIASELLYRVSFDVTDPKGEVRGGRQTINLTRNFVNPDIEVLGKQAEADLLYEDMAQDMADRILQRLKAQLL
jgi:LPS-assembly lipoprotein